MKCPTCNEEMKIDRYDIHDGNKYNVFVCECGDERRIMQSLSEFLSEMRSED